MLKNYILFAAAIVAEVIATTALARSKSFARLVPSLIVVVGYVVAFGLLSFPMRVMPAGIVYAIWSGIRKSSTLPLWSAWVLLLPVF